MDWAKVSISFVNGATGLMLGLSIVLPLDLWPSLRHNRRWLIPVGVVVAWAAAIAIAAGLDPPNDLIVRRIINGLIALYVSALLALTIEREWRIVRRTPTP